jgi:hypothetical protein
MRVVEELCTRTGPKGEIVVEANDLEGVKSLDARNLALDHAKKLGMSVPGFTGNSWTEWVDEAGKALEPAAMTTATTRLCRGYYPVQEATL